MQVAEEIATRAEIIQRALEIPHNEQVKILPLFKEYSEKYYDTFLATNIDLIRSRESLMGAGQSLEFIKVLVVDIGMETVIAQIYSNKKSWKENTTL